jgi:branched-chain amino acid transport system permease protein
MAIGAYVSAILSMPPTVKQPMLLPGLPTWLATFDSTGWHPQAALLFACLISGIVAAVIGALVGAPLMRLSGNYVAVATMGFLIIVHSVLVNWDEVTRGARGLSQIPTSTNPWIAYIWLAVAVYVALRLRNSPYGRAMIATRENLIASRSVGVSVLRTRLTAFIVSAFLTGVAGALLAHQIGTVAPSTFYFTTTFTVIIMVVLGGMGSISGAVVGAIIMTITPEVLRPIEGGFALGPLHVGTLYGLSNIILAIAFILIMIFRPQGLFGERELGLSLFSRRTPQQEWAGEDITITPTLAPEVNEPIPDSRA